ncbi:hypothetical protein, partial [Shinella sp.]|uniref:hypothetical protein n=1 Tax=Shinella sp. TaxID=1870904 RepID=UPI0039E39B1B
MKLIQIVAAVSPRLSRYRLSRAAEGPAGCHMMNSSLYRPLGALDFKDPAILLAGTVDYAMYAFFRDRLAAAPPKGLVVVELSTLGGDPEVARMMGEDIRFHSEQDAERRFVFLGKAAIYSAGATFMSFFARANRYLTRGTRVMIHERKLTTQIMLDGPLTTCGSLLRAKLNEIEHSIRIQNEGFQNLVNGSSLTLQDVLQRAAEN